MIVRVCVQSQAIKGKRRRDGWTSCTYAPPPKNSNSKTTPPMSTDSNIPLFKVSDRDDMIYKDNPTMTQVKVNLVVAEQVQ